MNKKIIGILSMAFVVAIFTSVSVAQDTRTVRAAAGSPYVISAKAGGVNYIQGRVSVNRKDSTSGYLLKGDSLELGDMAITGESSRTEILLNPGSYARLGANTRFSIINADLNDLQLRLDRGTAIFEVYAGNEFFVTVLTPMSRFYLVKSGVYRIDVLTDGTSRIEVRKGKAQVGTRNAKHLKKARSAVVDGNGVAISKFSRNDRDEFELWSRSRSKQLANANAALRRNTRVRNSINSDYYSGRFGNYNNSFGLWTYSSAFGGYCYLPFGSRRTPYGFGLNRTLGSFGFRRTVYYQPRSNSNNINGGNNGSVQFPVNNGNRVQPSAAIIEARRERRQQRRADRADGVEIDPATKAARRERRKQRRAASGNKSTSGSRNQSRSTKPRRSNNSGSRRSRPAPRRSSPPPRRSSPPARRSAPAKTPKARPSDN